MRLRCVGHGAKTTTADALNSAGVILGGTLLSVLVATWMRRQAVDPAYTKALINNGWLVGFMISMRYTTVKGWPGSAPRGSKAGENGSPPEGGHYETLS